MKKELQTAFTARQNMRARDFEIYYYKDCHLSNIKGHTHNYYEFCFFLEGNISMQIGDRLFPLKFGDVVLIPPGANHYAVIHDAEIPYRRFVLWISRRFYNQLTEASPDYSYLIQYAQETGDYIFHNDVLSFNAIQSKILRLLEEENGQRFGRETKIMLCLHDLLLHLNRQVYEKNCPRKPKETQSLYESLLDYIDGHLDEELTLDRLAEEFFVSKYHISHIFKENVGLSVHQYITRKRVSACRNAITGQTKISEVYTAFGFKDYTSFYRAFSREYGISPKEWKEQRSRFPGTQQNQIQRP